MTKRATIVSVSDFLHPRNITGITLFNETFIEKLRDTALHKLQALKSEMYYATLFLLNKRFRHLD